MTHKFKDDRMYKKTLAELREHGESRANDICREIRFASIEGIFDNFYRAMAHAVEDAGFRYLI